MQVGHELNRLGKDVRSRMLIQPQGTEVRYPFALTFSAGSRVGSVSAVSLTGFH